MSRVEEAQQKQAAEAERMQKTQDRATRDAKKTDESRKQFGELVKKGAQKTQGQEHQLKKKAEQQTGSKVMGQFKKQAQEQARTARLARGGVVHHQKLMEQTKSFQGTLQAQKQESAETTQARVSEREQGLTQTREAREERATDLDTKKQEGAERQKEAGKAEAKAEARVNSAIGGAGGGKGDSGNNQSGDGSGQAVAGTPSANVAAADGAQQAHEVKQIPEEILNALASEVYVGVNEKGLHEFRIELKDGVLQGGTLRVTSEGKGRISLQFDGLSGHAKNLVSASHTELAKRLSAKGLTLDDLRV